MAVWDNLTPEEKRERKIQQRIANGELVVRKDGQIVCSFCGGNCGQCGITSLIGCPPASMQQMADSLHGKPLTNDSLFYKIKRFLQLDRG